MATDKTSDGDTGSINTLSTTGLDMYDENVLFEFGTLWLVMTPILEKKFYILRFSVLYILLYVLYVLKLYSVGFDSFLQNNLTLFLG